MDGFLLQASLFGFTLDFCLGGSGRPLSVSLFSLALLPALGSMHEKRER
jgi:hypothetical protein